MKNNDMHRINDFDLYFGLSLLCFALNSPICGYIALAAALFIYFMSEAVKK